MKQKRRTAALAAGLVLVGTSVFGGVSAASAATVYVDGGKWRYGLYEPSSTIFVFSYFDHAKRSHRSTACNRFDCVQRTAGPGVTTKAEIQATSWRFGSTNYAYYYVY